MNADHPDWEQYRVALHERSPVPYHDMWVRPNTTDTNIVREVIERHTYERPRLGFRPEPGEVWADLGANVGAFAVKYAPVVARIHSFEPDPGSFEVLEANTRSLLNVVRYRAAIDAVPGTAELAQRLHQNSRNTLYPAGRWERRDGTPKYGTVRVPVLGVEDLPREVTCIKADIEGAERSVLEALDLGRYNKIVVEWSFDVWPHMLDYDQAVARLRAAYPNVRAPAYPKRPADGRWPSSWFPPCALLFAWR